MNSVLKYPGAKWCIASWIISYFPKHHSYLEPFLGSGGVFFTKDRSNIETINDLDGEIVNLFECIRNDSEKLAQQVYFTPYSRQVYEQSFMDELPADKYARAAQILVQSNMSHGFRSNGRKVGWKNDVAGRERAYAAKNWVELPDIIMDTAERLRGVQIECSPAAELIERFNSPEVLVYCDPPYVLSTRGGKQYRCEMTDNDHLHLLDILKRHKGPALISGYESPLYESELRGWHKERTTTTDQLSRVRKEALWMNFEPMEQTCLF